MKNPSALQTLLTQSFEAERSLRQFASVASQELLTLLISALEDLRSGTDLESAKGTLERAVFLSRNLRYFASGARTDFSLTDISQLVFDCLQMKEPDFEKKNISLHVRVDSSVFGLVDTLAVEQAILNLLDFASVHALTGSEAALSLQVFPRGLQLSLNFDGLSEESEEQGAPWHPCALENLEGQNVSRLGLFVCSSIVKWHSGTFQCFKSPNEGTQFLLEFPFDARMNKPHLFREKRRHQRVQVSFTGKLSSPRGEFFGKINILSRGGCFFAVSHAGLAEIKRDEKVSLEIQIDPHHTLSIPRARVANTHLTGENFGVGLEFLELDLKTKNCLAALIKAHAS